MADQKITQLAELTTPVLADLLAIVDDPSGSPITKKVTLEKIKDLIVVNKLTIMRGEQPSNMFIANNSVYEQVGSTIIIPDPGFAVDIYVSFNCFWDGNNIDANANAFSKCQISTDGGSGFTDGPETFINLPGGQGDRIGCSSAQVMNNVTPTDDIQVKAMVKGTKSSGTPGFQGMSINVIVVER